MSVEFLIKEEWRARQSGVVWSETLQTVSGCRVAMLNIESKMLDDCYTYMAMIDYGSEVGVETYNEVGEWNVGVLHPLNIIKKVGA